MKNPNYRYSPEYQKTLEILYENLFSGEDDGSEASEFWKRKGVQARECIRCENNRYEISKELFQLGHVRFDDYPWSDSDEIIFDGICPWSHRKRVLKFPFHKTSRPHQHRLAKLDRNLAK